MHLMSAVAMATLAFFGAAPSVPGPAVRFRGAARRQRPGTARGKPAGERSGRGPVVGGSSAALGPSVSCSDSGESASPSVPPACSRSEQARSTQSSQRELRGKPGSHSPASYWGSEGAQISLLFLRNLSLKLGYVGQGEQPKPIMAGKVPTSYNIDSRPTG